MTKPHMRLQDGLWVCLVDHPNGLYAVCGVGETWREAWFNFRMWRLLREQWEVVGSVDRMEVH